MKPVFSAVGIAVGLLLMAGSFGWSWVVRPANIWNEQQAEIHAAVSAELHHMQHEVRMGGHRHGPEDGHGHGAAGGGGADEARLAEVRAKFEASRRQLEAARSMQTLPATVLWWLGVVIAAGGVAGYLYLNSPWRRGQQS